MGRDAFEKYRIWDTHRAIGLVERLFWWECYLRHNPIESIEKENAECHNLEQAMFEFHEERLAPVTGNRWKKAAAPPSIALEAVVSASDVASILREHVPGYGTKVRPMFWDSEYYVCAKQGVAVYLGFSAIDKLPYQPNRQDCDDFAFEVYGEFRQLYQFGNIGVVIDQTPTSRHAYCFAVFPDDVWWIEPQNDGRIQIGDRPPYELEKGLLIL